MINAYQTYKLYEYDYAIQNIFYSPAQFYVNTLMV